MEEKLGGSGVRRGIKGHQDGNEYETAGLCHQNGGGR